MESSSSLERGDQYAEYVGRYGKVTVFRDVNGR